MGVASFLARSVTFTIPGQVGVLVTATEDGAGNIDFTAKVQSSVGDTADLGGLFFQYQEQYISGLKVTGPQVTLFQTGDDTVSNIAPGINMQGAPGGAYDVGIEFGTAGIGSNHQNITSTSFVLSDPGNTLTLDQFLQPGETTQFGARITSISGPNANAANSKITGLAPLPPTAHADAITTNEDVPVTIKIGDVATDPNGSALKFIKVSQPAHGTVTIASDGQSLTYTPSLDYANSPTTNQDSFLYGIQDALGGTDSAQVTTTVIPVADPPTVAISVLAPHAGDPIGETRLQVTATSGDFGTVDAGSDYIQSLKLSVTGSVPGLMLGDTAGLLNTATGTITPSNRSGQFIDEIDVTAPADTNLNDTFGVVATNAETEGTGNPATATGSASQTIAIDNAKTSQTLDFQATNQSIWDSGAAFSKTFDTGFIGIDKSAHGSTKATVLGTTVASAGGSIHFKAGFQADLHITAGDISADLPFNVALDSTYNKTTDTLQIMSSDAQLGGGSFTEHGPGGTLSFGLDLGLSASGHVTALGLGPSFSTSIGSFTKPAFTKSFKSSTLAVPIPLPDGLTLTLAFPTVNVSGSNANPGDITNSGTSHDFVNLAGDLVAIASLIATDGAKDVTDISVGPGTVDLLDILIGAGLNLVQGFDLKASGLTPTLTLEDGTVEPFTFGSPLTIANASTHDLNHDGKIGVAVGLTPDATLSNNTSIGANLTAEVQALGFSVGPIGYTVFDTKAALQLGTFPPIYKNTFPLAFNSQTVTQTV